MKRILLILIGSLSLGLGIIGIFLPLLPTTPFLLLSLGCYANSSEKYYTRLINNPILGAYIKEYKKEKGIRLHLKMYILVVLWGTMLGSIYFVIENVYLKIFLVILAIAISIHVLSFKTIKK